MNPIHANNHNNLPQGILDTDHLGFTAKIEAGALSSATPAPSPAHETAVAAKKTVDSQEKGFTRQLQSEFWSSRSPEAVIETARSPAMVKRVLQEAVSQKGADSKTGVATQVVDTVYNSLEKVSNQKEVMSARLDQAVVAEAVARAKDQNSKKEVTKELVNYVGLVGNDLPKETVKEAQRNVIALLNDNQPLDVTAMVIKLMSVMQQIRNQANASKIKQRELAYKLAMESAKQIEKEGATKFAAALTQGVISIGMATMAIRDTRKAYNDSKLAKENTINEKLGGESERVNLGNSIKAINGKIKTQNDIIDKKANPIDENEKRQLNEAISRKADLEKERTPLLERLEKAQAAGDKVADGIRDPLLAEANFKRTLGDNGGAMVGGVGSMINAGQNAERNRKDAEHSLVNNLQQETDKLYNNQSDNMAQINQFLEQYLRGQQEALSHVIRMV